MLSRQRLVWDCLVIVILSPTYATGRRIMPSSQRAIWGKSIINAIAIASQTRKGIAALQMSPKVVLGGATPFITYSISPKGGVVGCNGLRKLFINFIIHVNIGTRNADEIIIDTIFFHFIVFIVI